MHRVFQDSLLVRTGLTPTSGSEALRDEAAAGMRWLEVLLPPSGGTAPAALRRPFTVHTGPGRRGTGTRPARAGPTTGARRLAAELAEEWEAGSALGEGRIDLEMSIDHIDPKTQVEKLVTLRMSASVRAGIRSPKEPSCHQTG
ncbi:hypothetical protein [Streptomyces sp. P9-2]|uniref:hypothetical protein n=1 Tax=Streptomyces sp. P9-2 TaxID=3423201 RepID=UPI003F743B77